MSDLSKTYDLKENVKNEATNLNESQQDGTKDLPEKVANDSESPEDILNEETQENSPLLDTNDNESLTATPGGTGFAD